MYASHANLVGRVLGGRYRVIRPIGTGGMGSVFEAEQLGLNRKVALKVLHDKNPRALARLRQEALTAGGIRSPHVVVVFDFQANPGEPAFLVLELLEGESLSALLRREHSLSPERAARIGVQMLAGLDAAHQAGIIHRDVKPSNVWISRSPAGEVVKILDFGIVKARDPDGRAPRTTAGAVLGTPSYLSPEQLRGAPVGPRSDLHAVGVVLFEMLVGRKPWSTDTPQTLFEIMNHVPPAVCSLVSSVPPRLSEIVARALEKQPEARFESAGAMLTALVSVAEPSGSTEALSLEETFTDLATGEPTTLVESRSSIASRVGAPPPSLSTPTMVSAPIALSPPTASSPPTALSPPTASSAPMAASPPTAMMAPRWSGAPPPRAWPGPAALAPPASTPPWPSTPPLPAHAGSTGARRSRLGLALGIAGGFAIVGGGIAAFAVHAHVTAPKPVAPSVSASGAALGPSTTPPSDAMVGSEGVSPPVAVGGSAPPRSAPTPSPGVPTAVLDVASGRAGAGALRYGGELTHKDTFSSIGWGSCPGCDGAAWSTAVNAQKPRFAECFTSTIHDPPPHGKPRFEISVTADGAYAAVVKSRPTARHAKLDACVERVIRTVPLVKKGGGAGKLTIEFADDCTLPLGAGGACDRPAGSIDRSIDPGY